METPSPEATVTTTITDFRQTATTSDWQTKWYKGASVQLGRRFMLRQRLLLDLGLEIGVQEVRRFFGTKERYVSPMLQLGYGFSRR